jgi:hypothetical protein
VTVSCAIPEHLHVAIEANSRDDTSSVTERDDDGSCNSLLQRPSTVVGSPRYDDGNERVDSSSGQKETSVLNVGVLADQQEQESDQSQTGESNGNDTPLLESVRHVSGDNGGESSNDVWRHGHLVIDRTT